MSRGQVHERDCLLAATTDSARSFRAAASRLADAVIVKLDAGLRMCDTGPEHTAFFGCDVEGAPFSGFLPQGDWEKLASCARRASEPPMPLCMPATLLRSTSCQVLLVLLDQGSVPPGRCQVRYLLGVCAEGAGPADAPRPSDGDVQSVATRAARRGWVAPHEDLPGLLPSRAAAGEGKAPAHGPKGQPWSSPTSGGTASRGQGFRSVSPQPSEHCFSVTGMLPSIGECSELDYGRPTYPAAMLRQTRLKSQAVSFKMILPRWHKQCDGSACCPFHAAVESGNAVIAYLMTQRCDSRWRAFPVQCPHCTCMNRNIGRCVVCQRDLVNVLPDLE